MTAPASRLSLDHRYVDGDTDAPVLLLLHGTGGSPEDILGLGRALSPTSPMLAPAGPVTERGAARWFRRLAEGVFDTDDVLERAVQLARFVTDARERYGLGDRRLVAAGFSNGANIAAAVTLLRPDVLREAALFAAMLPVAEPPAHDLAGTRVFLGNGRDDPMAPTTSSERLVAMLAERGADVEQYWHAGGHRITEEGIAAARRWLVRR